MRTYQKDAQALINAIWQYEVNANRYLKPGDAWDTKKDPSYFSTGALELFKSVDSHDWSTVIANSFTLLKKVCNQTTGLLSGNFTPMTQTTIDARPWAPMAAPAAGSRYSVVMRSTPAGRYFSLTGKKPARPGPIAMQPLIRTPRRAPGGR